MKKLRQNSSFSVSNPRWFAYAAAGAASALGGTQSAEAEIHYSGVINRPFQYEGRSGVFPIAHSARLRFRFFTYTWDFAISGAAVSNRWCAFTTQRYGGREVARLSEGAVISNCSVFVSGTRGFLLNSYGYGQFAKGGSGFIGFRFNNGAGVQYGWARLQSKGHYEAAFKLVDYAWADPGESISAGQTSLARDQAEAIPDQGSLGLLALGGAGLITWRRRRTKTDSESLTRASRSP
ncbi:MAG TPA: hypothetical protein VH207_09945 [Chthoniobacterales bacterium]|jgi:hypothetical protein|nr:hypothetical protein [Chthoniobacterales bacterium]